MYISRRAVTMRNLFVSLFNGAITLVILLIAPLGLAAVIFNTLVVTAATYTISTVADKIVAWLQPPVEADLLSPSSPSSVSRRHRSASLPRWRPW